MELDLNIYRALYWVTISIQWWFYLREKTPFFLYFFSVSLGFTCYFFFLAAFLWLSVLCCDIWLNFKDINTEINANKNKKLFIIYSLYAWLGAGSASIISFIVQKSKSIDNIYKPGIGIRFCWLNGKYRYQLCIRLYPNYSCLFIIPSWYWNYTRDYNSIENIVTFLPFKNV